jgi:hypothetical protein
MPGAFFRFQGLSTAPATFTQQPFQPTSQQRSWRRKATIAGERRPLTLGRVHQSSAGGSGDVGGPSG